MPRTPKARRNVIRGQSRTGEEINVGYFESPIGLIKVAANDKRISHIGFVKKRTGKRKAGAMTMKKTNKTVERCVSQIREYFEGKRTVFEINTVFEGPSDGFRTRVLRETSRIGFGQTKSYTDIAKAIKLIKARRAVGKALGLNPMAIVIPCHRVIAQDGGLSGFAWGAWRKKRLLEHEANISKSAVGL